LFALRQSLAAFHYYRELVVEVDEEIQHQLGSLETAATAEATGSGQNTDNHFNLCILLITHRLMAEREEFQPSIFASP